MGSPFPERSSRKHSAPIRGAAFSPSRQFFATGAEDGTICVWTYPELTLLHRLRAPSPVTAVSVSHTQILVGTSAGTLVAFPYTEKIGACGSGPVEVTIGPVPEHKVIHFARINFLIPSIDGSRLLSGASDQITRLWDAGTLSLLEDAVPEGGGGTLAEPIAAAWHPTKKACFVGLNSGKIVRYGSGLANPTVYSPHTDWVFSVAVHGSGHFLLVGGEEGAVVLLTIH
jgi:WD40 repeat protein